MLAIFNQPWYYAGMEATTYHRRMATTTTVREIPEEVHRRFKAACVMDGISMNDMLIELMREYGDRRERETSAEDKAFQRRGGSA